MLAYHHHATDISRLQHKNDLCIRSAIISTGHVRKNNGFLRELVLLLHKIKRNSERRDIKAVAIIYHGAIIYTWN
jgi:hypothetical protein